MNFKNRMIKSALTLLLVVIFIIINKNYSYGKKYTFSNETNSNNNINPYSNPKIGLEDLLAADNLFCVDYGSNLGYGKDDYYIAGAEKNEKNNVKSTQIYFNTDYGNIQKVINWQDKNNNSAKYEFFKIAYITAGGDSNLYGLGYSNSGSVDDYTYRQQALYKEWNYFANYSETDRAVQNKKIFAEKSNNNSAPYGNTAEQLRKEADIYASVMTNSTYKEEDGKITDIKITNNSNKTKTEISIQYTGILTYLYIEGYGYVDASILKGWGIGTGGSKTYIIDYRESVQVSAWATSTKNNITIWSARNQHIYCGEGSYNVNNFGQCLIGVDGTINRRWIRFKKRNGRTTRR